jgi:hypothetical protein
LVGLLLRAPRTRATTALDLSWNADVGADGLRALAHGLARAAAPLRCLDLSGATLKLNLV